MNIPSSFGSANHDGNLFVSSQARERALNRAMVAAEISRSYEEYLEIFDRFYAEDLEVSSADTNVRIQGKASVCSLLCDFLIPLHIMAEIGGVSVSIRQIAMPGDAADETHSAWTLELVGATGRTCTLSWRTLRKWKDSVVVYEHQYDTQQSGGPLTDDDFTFGGGWEGAAPGAPVQPQMPKP